MLSKTYHYSWKHQSIDTAIKPIARSRLIVVQEYAATVKHHTARQVQAVLHAVWVPHDMQKYVLDDVHIANQFSSSMRTG